jgi:hypothetical protein
MYVVKKCYDMLERNVQQNSQIPIKYDKILMFVAKFLVFCKKRLISLHEYAIKIIRVRQKYERWEECYEKIYWLSLYGCATWADFVAEKALYTNRMLGKFSLRGLSFLEVLAHGCLSTSSTNTTARLPTGE